MMCSWLMSETVFSILAIRRSRQFVLFDMRVANIEKTVSDMSQAHAIYGDAKAPLVIAGFDNLLRTLSTYERDLKSVEVTGYRFPIGSFGWLSDSVPESYVLSVLLERRPSTDANPQNPTDWYVKVPPDLLAGMGLA